ncbi:MAG TPA: serine/threonine-protein kinase, partial [Bdellovibrionota bacterium]|nr:serine/threonine-protein kinase [Bdellovibrionota bacterium]
MEPIRFGFYLLVRKIASGERAELFEAKRLGPARERNLVVKRFRAKVPKQSDLVHNFIRRARLARNLQHPNIARLHDFGEVEGSYFTATEYVIGVDFSHLLRRQVEHSDKLMAQLSVYIVQEVLATLTYAHGWVDVEGEHTPILHQGIKPSNVLVTMDGKIKVTDYGLSRVFLDAPSLGSANLPKGDSFFVSPEQLKGGVIDRRSDLFSLGALLLYLLSQRFITETTTREEFLDLLLLEDFFEALNFREDKAQLLRDTVIRSLRVNRNERFQTATEFLKALEPIVPAEVHPQLAAQLSTHVQRVLGIRSHETETLLWDEELLTEPEGMSETAPGPSPKRWTARWRAPMAFIGIILVTAGYLAARRLSRSENVSGRQNAKMDLKV